MLNKIAEAAKEERLRKKAERMNFDDNDSFNTDNDLATTSGIRAKMNDINENLKVRDQILGYLKKINKHKISNIIPDSNKNSPLRNLKIANKTSRNNQSQSPTLPF